MNSSASAPAPAGTKMILDPALAAQVDWHKAQIRALLGVYNYRKSLACAALTKLYYSDLDFCQPPINVRGKLTTREWLAGCVVYLEHDMERYLARLRELENAYKDILLAAVENWEAEEAVKLMQEGPQGEMDGETEG